MKELEKERKRTHKERNNDKQIDVSQTQKGIKQN